MDFKRVQKFLRTHMILIGAMIFFLLSTFVLTRFTHIFISPDETGNAFFVRAFAESGSFRVFDALNQAYGGILHPRSIITDGAYLIPGSFLGLAFLYGGLSKILGSWSLTFITPLLVLLATLAWNQILRRWFSSQIAFISSLLFLFHPAIWYYTSRSLMPNVLFICCVIFSVFFLLRFSNGYPQGAPLRSIRPFLLSGLFLSLALFVRLSELYWLIPLFAVLIYAEPKSLRTPLLSKEGLGGGLTSLAFGFAIGIGLILFFNFTTYGHPLTFGYSFVSNVSSPLQRGELEGGLVSEERLSWLLPFGFHPRSIFWNTVDYLFVLFWWLTIPTLCALPLVLRERKQKIYTIMTIAIALWLCIWYGSWQLNDNPDSTQITIANSYVRYWLPVFVMSTPLVATAILWLSERFRSKIHRKHILFSCMLLLLALNARIVFFEGQDALVRMVSVLQQSEQIRDTIYRIVPENAVIIVDRSDKLFFPGRHVLVPLRSEVTYAAIPKLVEQTPVFYYGVTLPEKDLDFLNQRKFVSSGLSIEFLQSFGVESLYQITHP